MKLFLSGPFFNEEETSRLNKVKNALESLGYEVYSTSHANKRINLIDPEEKNRRFSLLCEEIKKSDAVFAILDGRDPGTIWETGYAFALSKPVIAFSEKDAYFSLMIDQSSTYLIGMDSIDNNIEKFIKEKDINLTPKYFDSKKIDY
jgi:nucleoside deoxyribosyltransferase